MLRREQIDEDQEGSFGGRSARCTPTSNPLSFFLKNPDIVVQCSHMENILIPSPANKDTGRLRGRASLSLLKQNSKALRGRVQAIPCSPRLEWSRNARGFCSQAVTDQRGDHLPLSLGEQEEQRSLRPYGIFSTSSDSPTLFPAFSFFSTLLYPISVLLLY